MQVGSEPMAHGIITSVTQGAMSGNLPYALMVLNLVPYIKYKILCMFWPA